MSDSGMLAGTHQLVAGMLIEVYRLEKAVSLYI
jgi:hypothetical protein